MVFGLTTLQHYGLRRAQAQKGGCPGLYDLKASCLGFRHRSNKGTIGGGWVMGNKRRIHPPFEPVARYLSLVRFPHTVFALPFALISYLAATEGTIEPRSLVLVLLAMVAARTTAMTFNRIVDRRIDAANPRTAQRELVTGAVSLNQAWLLLVLSALLFVLAAYGLNPLAFALSPAALAVLLGYSYTKRFTWLSHFFLGLALGLAPVGAWIAVTGRFALSPILLGLGVVLWVAGFDIIYSCQDYAHDTAVGLHSMVVRFGLKDALRLSSLLHALALPLFLGFALLQAAGVIFYGALALVGASFVYQHSIISPDDLSRVNRAFFTTNGVVGIGLLLAYIIDLCIT